MRGGQWLASPFVCPDPVVRQAHHEVLRDTELPVALMVSLSNHEGVVPHPQRTIGR